MKVLAIDWGRAHIGLALSDDSGSWAFPRGEYTPADVLPEIDKIIDREDVQMIIIGNPLPLDGKSGPEGERQLQDVQRFADSVAAQSSVSVALVDERFSNTKEAARAYPDAGDHERAAAVLLQDYLSRKKQ